ncbi:hypothetical protein PDE_03659 [Penicillium oxalicum 114-2]|uniref:Uncharacterized protein n=1 Tax=Penicillium oxalicum (strain 114-2 / CGMCC 5302) TaxID=933388 RepID=S8ARR8_PENO1|nr:hypothetical protein PDE_03659 [Penicillium oxalicum 114-2]
MVLYCPPWRKPRPTSPSEIARFYQGIPSCETQVQQQQEQDTGPLELEHADSDAKPHTGSLTRIIRRRFSRESKGSITRHDQGKLPFPFARKSPKPSPKHPAGLAVPAGYGSSLMSESRYDSDAHDVSTPQKEPAQSPPSNPQSNIRLSDLIEQSQEQRESERWGTAMIHDLPESPGSVCGMRFLRTPPASLRSHPGPYLKEQHSQLLHSVENNSHHTINSAKSMPDMYSAQQGSGRSGDIPSPLASPSLDTTAERQIEDSRCESRITSFSDPMLGSVADLCVTKRRQRTDSGMSMGDNRTVHLEDIDISKRLISQSGSTAPLSPDPSMSESVQLNQGGLSTKAPGENSSVPYSPTTHSLLGHAPGTIQLQSLESSSSRSQDSIILSPDVSLQPASFANHGETPTDMAQRSKYDPAAEDIRAYMCAAPAAPDLITSKFDEHCDSEVSLDTKVSALRSEVQAEAPRKVSIGWMSGGRRVGYGYAPVSNPEDESVLRDPEIFGGSQADLSQMPDLSLPVSVISSGIRRDSPCSDYNQHRYPVNATYLTIPKKSRLDHSLAHFEAIQPATFLRTKRCSKASERSQARNGGSNSSTQTGSGNLSTVGPSPGLDLDVGLRLLGSIDSSAQLDALKQPSVCFSQSDDSGPQSAEGMPSLETANLEPPQLRHTRSVSKGSYKDVDIDPDYPGIEYDYEAQFVARLLRPNNARGPPAARRHSKFRVNKQYSSSSPRKGSRSSLALDQTRGSSSLERVDSTISIGADAEDLASMYRECLHMPGSFEGSQWASPSSRFSWNRPTNDEQ